MAELFIERNQEPLRELFWSLDMDPKLATDLPAAVAATQPWVKGDHVRPGNKIDIDEGIASELHDIYGLMGLKEEQPLPAGNYEQILVLGGMMLGMNRRLAFANRMFATAKTDNIVLLGGQRSPYPESEAHLIAGGLLDVALRDKHDRWVRDVLSGEARIQWETDMMRLAATNQLGRLRPHTEDHYMGEPFDTPELSRFGWRSKVVHLLHTKAVQRPNGPPRHTTEACLEHWAKILPPAQDARIGFVTANPHIERTGKVAQAAVRAVHRDDIELVVGGSAAAPVKAGSGHAIYLGEIARNLYEDQRSFG